jgi:hypothetical protein
MTKEEKLIFLNKELDIVTVELGSVNETMSFLGTLSEVPEVYIGNFYNSERTIAFFEAKILWIQQKIQEIESE